MNIALDYSITYEEWVEAFRAGNRSTRQDRRPTIALMITAPLLTVVLILIAIDHTPRLFSTFFFILSTAFLIAVLCWFMLQRKINDLAQIEWNSNPTLRVRCIVTLDESGIEVSQEYHQTRWQWPAFIRFDQTRDLLLLYISQRNFVPLPKRAFSREDLDSFIEFLLKTLPPTQPASKGFAVIAKSSPPTPVHVQPLESREFL